LRRGHGTLSCLIASDAEAILIPNQGAVGATVLYTVSISATALNCATKKNSATGREKTGPSSVTEWSVQSLGFVKAVPIALLNSKKQAMKIFMDKFAGSREC
jgi:hypothetical protein